MCSSLQPQSMSSVAATNVLAPETEARHHSDCMLIAHPEEQNESPCFQAKTDWTKQKKCRLAATSQSSWSCSNDSSG
jgi:hypothetical protein